MRRGKWWMVAVGLLALLVPGAAMAQDQMFRLWGTTGATWSGESGMFEVVSGDVLPGGTFSASSYMNAWSKYSVPLHGLGSLRDRNLLMYDRYSNSVSFGYGIGDHFELSLGASYDRVKAFDETAHGFINGTYVYQQEEQSDWAPLHAAFKVGGVLTDDGAARLAFHGGVYVPTEKKHNDSIVQSGRTDYHAGVALSYKWVSLDISHMWRGDRDEADIENEWHGGIGADIPMTTSLNLLWELNYVAFPHVHQPRPFEPGEPRDQMDTTLGIRWFMTDQLAVNAGARVNLSYAFRTGREYLNSHNGAGGVVGVTFYPRKNMAVETEVTQTGTTVAKTVPCPVITVPANGGTVSTSSPTVAGTAEPNATIRLALDGAPDGEVQADASGSWSTTLRGLSDGTHAVAATQTSAGVSSENCGAIRFTVAQPVQPTPPPVQPAPERSTTDEISFDRNSARISNIAKAVLDQVALRMKSEPSATAMITGYAETGEKNAARLAKQRADAARTYLMTRHGLDGSRIMTDAAKDTTMGRKDVIKVTIK
jgi:outer membrane protein OmpA-like peptidoglycan-associated protein